MSDLTQMEIEAVTRKKGLTELYRHFDAKGTLLYVGISLSTAHRLGEHRCGSAWSKKTATITIERYSTRQAALDAERHAIQTEHPVHNVTGKKKPPRVTPSPRLALVASDPDERQESPLTKYFRERGYAARRRLG